ncbi:MAG: hypothetical protein KKF67_00770 [Nanoarchaeota archaeon]|nr:hypothetical protein [Nanoarchaeota archaeon]
MSEQNNLTEILGCAVSIQDGGERAIILIRRDDKYERVELTKEKFKSNTNFNYSELTWDEYVSGLEKLPKPYLMSGEVK